MSDKKRELNDLVGEVVSVAFGKDKADIATVYIDDLNQGLHHRVGFIVGVDLRKTTPEILAVLEVLEKMIETRKRLSVDEEIEIELPGFEIEMEVNNNN
jgi:hypothetical protein